MYEYTSFDLGISNILPRRKEALGGIWYLALCSTPAGTFRSSVTWILWLPVNAWTLISNLLKIKFFCTFRIVVDITQLGKLCLIVCLGRRCCNVSNCPPKLIDFSALASILGRFAVTNNASKGIADCGVVDKTWKGISRPIPTLRIRNKGICTALSTFLCGHGA